MHNAQQQQRSMGRGSPQDARPVPGMASDQRRDKTPTQRRTGRGDHDNTPHPHKETADFDWKHGDWA